VPGQPGLHRETLSQKTKNKQKKKTLLEEDRRRARDRLHKSLCVTADRLHFRDNEIGNNFCWYARPEERATVVCTAIKEFL
jgi:transposase